MSKIPEENCPVNQYTADGWSAGPCWHYCGPEGVCPIHGDVKPALKYYQETGIYMPEFTLTALRQFRAGLIEKGASFESFVSPPQETKSPIKSKQNILMLLPVLLIGAGFLFFFIWKIFGL